MNTIRARLTFWNALILSVLFLAFGAAALLLTRFLLTAYVQDSLFAATNAFSAEFTSELAEYPSRDSAVGAALNDFQFEGTRTVVLGAPPARTLLAITSRPFPVTLHGDATPELDLEQLLAAMAAADPARGAFLTLPGELGGFHAYVRPYVVAGDSLLVAVVQPRTELRASLRRALVAFGIAAPVLIALAALAGYLLSGRSLAPVSAIGRRAAEISAQNLHERVPVAHANDELGVLAGVINGLLDRVEHAFEQQRRFMADASHELRTPVAILRNESEIALGVDERAAAEYQAALRIVRGEGVRLTRIVNDLFLLARADIGEQPLQIVELYLDELAADTVRGLRSLADERGVSVEVVANGDAPMRGDEDLLRRLLSNLIENGIKHGRPGGSVTVHVESDATEYRVEVSDDGPGIPPESQPHVFERFHRADKARGRAEGRAPGGAGLGLAISRWVAEAHGGTLDLVHSDSRGTTLRLILPDGRPSPSLTDHEPLHA